MWNIVTPDLPYLRDPDYLQSLTFQIRSAMGPDVEVDPTLAEEGYQTLEVETDDDLALSRVPMVRSVRRFHDRVMRTGGVLRG